MVVVLWQVRYPPKIIIPISSSYMYVAVVLVHKIIDKTAISRFTATQRSRKYPYQKVYQCLSISRWRGQLTNTLSASYSVPTFCLFVLGCSSSRLVNQNTTRMMKEKSERPQFGSVNDMNRCILITVVLMTFSTPVQCEYELYSQIHSDSL